MPVNGSKTKISSPKIIKGKKVVTLLRAFVKPQPIMMIYEISEMTYFRIKIICELVDLGIERRSDRRSSLIKSDKLKIY